MKTAAQTTIKRLLINDIIIDISLINTESVEEQDSRLNINYPLLPMFSKASMLIVV